MARRGDRRAVAEGAGGSPRPAARRPCGFTLIEIMICIGIIGILITMLLPGVQAAREAARRRQCVNNLAQLLLAMEHYESAHETLPPGTIDATRPLASRPLGYQIGWIAQLLPYFEQGTLYRRIDFSAGAYAPQNDKVRMARLNVLQCPADWTSFAGGGNYAGCHHDVEAPIDEDNHGVLYLNSRVRYRDIRDGRAQTIALGEILKKGGAELGWLSGSRSTLRNTGTPINRTTTPGGPLATMIAAGLIRQQQPLPPDALPERSPLPDSTAPMPWKFTKEYQVGMPELQPNLVGKANPALVVGGFESSHWEGANFAFADGSVRYLTEAIDMNVYRRMGGRADGELMDDR